jgi:hypothetical protein
VRDYGHAAAFAPIFTLILFVRRFGLCAQHAPLVLLARVSERKQQKSRLAQSSTSDKSLMLGGGGVVASIIQFIRIRSDFDDEMTRIMGEAFDAACKALHDTGQPFIVREIMAKRVIDAAKAGERDPTRLRDIALMAVGNKTAR